MSMEYIRRYYGVPARRGYRVVVDGKLGVIVASKGSYLRVKFDGQKYRPSNHHPTWRVEYLKGTP